MTDLVLKFHTELTKVLNELEEKDLLDENAAYINDPVTVQEYIGTTNIDTYFFEAFTTPKGNMHYPNINDIESRFDIKINPGEKDSFGWLSAVITTPKGKLVVM